VDWISYLPLFVVATVVGVILLARAFREVYEGAVPGYRWTAVRGFLRAALRTPLGLSLLALLLALAGYLMTLLVYG
jgi:hypothetical protein